MSAPLIGLPGRRKFGRDISGFPEVLEDKVVDLYFSDYARGIIAAGGLPVHLPLDADPVALASRLDGVLLTGGTDIEPYRYGGAPHPEVLTAEPERDDFELALFRRAVEVDTPVLGICRGLQLINTASGGTLLPHMAAHVRMDLPAETEVHTVRLEPGSRLHQLYGDELSVNSLHHQGVDQVGSDLRVTAAAPDGGIEGLELGQSVVAVQWHPEMMTTSSTDPVFGWLVAAATAVKAS